MQVFFLYFYPKIYQKKIYHVASENARIWGEEPHVPTAYITFLLICVERDDHLKRKK